jgi:fructose-specific component phosphotransferase system IIB-like protein
MDGIDRYFNPNTLDGISIYSVDEALLVDGSNAMQADADMGGHNVKNVADATAPDEAINLGQFSTAIAGKADITYVNAQDALRVLKAGDSMTGDLTMGGNKVTGLGAATANGQAVRYEQLILKADTTYVNAQDALRVLKAGDTMTGNLAMGGNKVTGLDAATANGQAVRYEQLTLKADTTYVDAQDALRVLKAGDTMSGNLAMGGFKVTGLAAASANGEAVRYEQLTAVDANCVHKTGNETISGIKTFTTLPETALTATTQYQLVNRQTALSYIPFDNFGLVHFTTGRNTPLTYARLYASNIGHYTSPLAVRTYERSYLYGTTVTLQPYITYYGCVIRSTQNFTFPSTYAGAVVQIGIYSVDNGNLLAVTNIHECVDTTVAINGNYRNHYIGFQTPFTPALTDTYIVVVDIANAPSQSWGFLGAAVNNGDVFQFDLNTVAGFPLKTHQKGWASTSGGYGSLPASISINCNTTIPIWVGLTGLPNNFM